MYQPNEVRSLRNFQDDLIMVCQDDLWHQRSPHHPRLLSGTFSVHQVWLQGQGVLDTLLIMLEHWNLADNQKSHIMMIHDVKDGSILQDSNQEPSASSLYDFEDGGSWHTFIHARELKFGTQVKNHISWQSMMSTMTPSSKYQVRNPQHPPSMDFKDRGLLTHF